MSCSRRRFLMQDHPGRTAAPLPGGDFAHNGRDQLARELAAAFPPLGAATSDRLARTYGTMARHIFAGVCEAGDLGIHFGAGLYEREVVHLVENEWAMTADDVLWRRTKLGLRMSEAERSRLSDWISARGPTSASSAA